MFEEDYQFVCKQEKRVKFIECLAVDIWNENHINMYGVDIDISVWLKKDFSHIQKFQM